MKKKRKWPWVLLTASALFLVVCYNLGDEAVSSDNGSAFASNHTSAPPNFQESIDSILTDDTGSSDLNLVPADPSEYQADDTWAIYWYLCGSDLETDAGCASADMEELTTVTLPENITVVIETGGAKEWQNGVDSDVNSRYVYNRDGLQLVQKNPRVNMGDGRTLEAFLRFCDKNYSADHQAVIFWDHGGGSAAGVIFDELYDFDSLSIREIRDAFEAVHPPSKENPPYELVGFDACLMANIDVADTFNGLARWLVASEETEPGIGWDYAGSLQRLADNPGMNGGQWGKAICDTFYAACEDSGEAEEATLSVVDLSRVDALVAAYHDIGAESLIYACLDTDYFSDFGRAARKAINYGGNNFWDGYTNMVDLGDLVRQSGDELLPEYGAQMLSALEDCVVYQVRGEYRDRASGLSCYYNYDGDYESFTAYAALREENPFRWFYDYAIQGELSSEGMQYVYLLAEKYSQTKTIAPRKMKSLKEDNLANYPVEISSDGNAVLELGSDIADRLTGVYCNLAYFDAENDIAVVLGKDNDLDADWENGVFTDNFRGVWGAIDGALVYMELTDEAEDFQLYTVPVLLNNEPYSLSVSYTYDSQEYRILCARRGIDDSGMADKNLRQLKPGDVLEPLLFVFSDMDDPDEDPEQKAFESVTVTADTCLEETDLGDGLFVFLFEMVDAKNESYLSDAVVFSVENGEIYLLD